MAAKPVPLRAIDSIALPEKHAWLDSQLDGYRELATDVLFSTKEIAIKCLYTAAGSLARFIIRPVNTLRGFPAAAQPGTRPAWVHAACHRAGASLYRINPAYIYPKNRSCIFEMTAMPHQPPHALTPTPLPEGEGLNSLLPLGEGLGMRA